MMAPPTQSDASHESLPVVIREYREPSFDQCAGRISVVEHVAKVDHVEDNEVQIAQIVVHGLDHLVGR
jgi:hypothetical protein